MDKRPQLSRRDLIIILTYGGAILATVILLYLIGILRNGILIPASDSHHVEIAILVPQSGAQAAMGKTIVQVAVKSLAFYLEKNPKKNWDILIMSYDAGDNAHSAALAAQSAAQRAATIAIIGPINARQVAAAADTIQGKQIVLISPASEASTLDLSSLDNVYRILAPDLYQGDAIVGYLDSNNLNDVFLIVDPGKYSNIILDRFNKVANNRVKIAGTVSLDTGIPTDFIQNLSRSKADAIVFLGGSKYFPDIMTSMKNSNISIPIIGVEAINDEKIATNLTGAEHIFFTSSALINGVRTGQFPGDYQEMLGDLAGKPYAYETSQAMWALLAVLDQVGTNESPRIEIQKNLISASLPNVLGGRVSFIDGQMMPTYIYVYAMKSSIDSPVYRFSIPQQ